MTEYPKMLYKLGDKVLIDGKYFDTIVVNSDFCEKIKLREGWKYTPLECLKVRKKYKKKVIDVLDEKTDN